MSVAVSYTHLDVYKRQGFMYHIGWDKVRKSKDNKKE